MAEDTREDYLKFIFKGLLTAPQVRSHDIAKRLGVSKPAVTDMLKKLSKDGYVVYQPYKGVTLTTKGQKKGAMVVRRHRIWEMYLNKVLGFSWDAVHVEAEKLEHASSDALIDKLEEELGFPRFDPHGDPIPSKTGKLPDMKDFLPLSGLKSEEIGRVVRVTDHSSQFLNYLDEIGLSLDGSIEVKEVRSFDGSMLIQVKKDAHTVSQYCAEHIFVEKK